MQESEKAYLLAHEAHMEILKRAAGDDPVPMNFFDCTRGNSSVQR